MILHVISILSFVAVFTNVSDVNKENFRCRRNLSIEIKDSMNTETSNTCCFSQVAFCFVMKLSHSLMHDIQAISVNKTTSCISVFPEVRKEHWASRSVP